MTTYSYGGAVNNTNFYSNYTNNFLYTDGYGMQTGNVASNGRRYVKIYSVATAWSSGATYHQINYNNFVTGGGDIFDTTGGGTFRHMVGHGAGTLKAGRNTGNGLSLVDSASGVSAAGGICGSYEWATVPTAPTITGVTAEPAGKITVTFTGSGVSDGGTGVTGWVLNYATNSSFSGGTTVGSSGTTTIQGVPGTTYYFRAAARNDVTNGLAGGSSIFGAWSGTKSVTAKAGGSIYVGGAWKAANPYIYNGSSWVQANGQIYNSGWKNIS